MRRIITFNNVSADGYFARTGRRTGLGLLVSLPLRPAGGRQFELVLAGEGRPIELAAREVEPERGEIAVALLPPPVPPGLRFDRKRPWCVVDASTRDLDELRRGRATYSMTYGSSPLPATYSSRSRPSGRGPELLTNASRFPSGDHEGTLMVPCPPYTYAITREGPPPTGITRSSTCL
jgi:hypothetical protein